MKISKYFRSRDWDKWEYRNPEKYKPKVLMPNSLLNKHPKEEQ